jgi:hypothetical protein
MVQLLNLDTQCNLHLVEVAETALYSDLRVFGSQDQDFNLPMAA